MIILGSGGHTGELLIMLSKLNFNKFTDCFIISSHNDLNSNNKAAEVIPFTQFPSTKFHYQTIYRSRNVGQSFKSSIITTIIATCHAMLILTKTRPSIIVSNGPGVAMPLLFSAKMLKLIGLLAECKLLFIESFCRTKSVSLTGKIVERICDRFIVLWDTLKTNDKRREFIGKIL